MPTPATGSASPSGRNRKAYGESNQVLCVRPYPHFRKDESPLTARLPDSSLTYSSQQTKKSLQWSTDQRDRSDRQETCVARPTGGRGAWRAAVRRRCCGGTSAQWMPTLRASGGPRRSERVTAGSVNRRLSLRWFEPNTCHPVVPRTITARQSSVRFAGRAPSCPATSDRHRPPTATRGTCAERSRGRAAPPRSTVRLQGPRWPVRGYPHEFGRRAAGARSLLAQVAL